MVGIDHYYQEHLLMRQVVDAFSRYVREVEAGTESVERELGRFVAFFRDYGDLGHHDKEESILVPALVRGGLSWGEGPIATIRAEHDHERYLLRVLWQASLQPRPWSRPQRQAAVSTARSHIELVRRHIAFEEEEVFAQARASLGAAGERQLESQTCAFDAEWNVRGELSSLRALADELVQRYGS